MRRTCTILANPTFNGICKGFSSTHGVHTLLCMASHPRMAYIHCYAKASHPRMAYIIVMQRLLIHAWRTYTVMHGLANLTYAASVWSHHPITLLLHILRDGQNHIYTLYIRHVWQGNHQIYGHIRCVFTVLVNSTHTAWLDRWPCMDFRSLCKSWAVSLLLLLLLLHSLPLIATVSMQHSPPQSS
jgi:hypothetical protein